MGSRHEKFDTGIDYKHRYMFCENVVCKYVVKKMQWCEASNLYPTSIIGFFMNLKYNNNNNGNTCNNNCVGQDIM